MDFLVSLKSISNLYGRHFCNLFGCFINAKSHISFMAYVRERERDNWEGGALSKAAGLWL